MSNEIRRIIDSKEEDGSVKYLVDWAPSWVEAKDVTDASIKHYESYKDGVKIFCPITETMHKPRNEWSWLIQMLAFFCLLS